METDFERFNELFDYDPDTGILINKISRGYACIRGDEAGTLRSDGYRYVKVKQIKYLSHRVAWLLIYGNWPENEIDHINGIKGDNSICNPREALHSENMLNQKLRTNNTSGYKGVSYFKRTGKWVARIRIDGKKKSLGYFDTAEEAHEAYKQAAIERHGEFANFG